MLLPYFFFLMPNLWSLPLKAQDCIKLRTARLRNFLRNWSIRFPQGHRDGKGGGEERARGWPEQRDPDSGPWVLPSVFFPPQPLPFHPTPRQLRNPGAD